MEMLLQITGWAFIPIMAYILFLGTQDIISVFQDQIGAEIRNH